MLFVEPALLLSRVRVLEYSKRSERSSCADVPEADARERGRWEAKAAEEFWISFP